MRKIQLIAILTSAVLAQAGFAHGSMMKGSACEPIAKACVKGGFAKADNKMKFWQDCMKPLILGKSVKGVSVDAATVKACRESKIEKMKKELAELQSVSD